MWSVWSLLPTSGQNRNTRTKTNSCVCFLMFCLKQTHHVCIFTSHLKYVNKKNPTFFLLTIYNPEPFNNVSKKLWEIWNLSCFDSTRWSCCGVLGHLDVGLTMMMMMMSKGTSKLHQTLMVCDLNKSWKEILQEEDHSYHHESTGEEHQPEREVSCRANTRRPDMRPGNTDASGEI